MKGFINSLHRVCQNERFRFFAQVAFFYLLLLVFYGPTCPASLNSSMPNFENMKKALAFLKSEGLFHWRRERDSNPWSLAGSLVFKTSSLNHSDISPF